MIHLSMQKNIVKKIASDVDNYAAFSEKRYQMICQMQNFLKEGCSYREIAKRMGIGRNTIAKYRKGDPKELSMYGIHQSKLDPFHDFIIDCLKEGCFTRYSVIFLIFSKITILSQQNASFFISGFSFSIFRNSSSILCRACLVFRFRNFCSHIQCIGPFYILYFNMVFFFPDRN